MKNLFGFIGYNFYDYLYFDSFLLFYINKFMIEEHYHSYITLNQLSDHHKRKSASSQYASRIKNIEIVLIIIC